MPSSFLTILSQRPIALVSSLDKDGQNENLAPFSYFNVMSHDPPTLVIGICRNGDGSPKDTFRNVESSREFVVNIISENYVQNANKCASVYPYGTSELDEAGLSRVGSHVVRASRVKEATVSFECKVVNFQDVVGYNGEVSATIVTAEVVMMHVLKEAFDEKSSSVDLEKLRPVGRLGGCLYGSSNTVYPLPRYPFSPK